MIELKTVDIKGKKYVPVNERLRYFRNAAQYFGYRLTSTFVELKEDSCVIRATILDPSGVEVATGFAREVRDDGFINKSSFIENCETSAWGRALANFGIGVDSSIASAEEIMADMSKQNGNVASTLDEILKDAHCTYGQTQGTEIPEGSRCDFKKFKDALRTVVKAKLKTQEERKSFAWTAENLKPYLADIKLADTLVEIERNSDG